METFKKADITFMEGLRWLGMKEEEEPKRWEEEEPEDES